jgi:transposase
MIGLPSLQALDHPQGPRIWLAAEATDMRCGFDRLAERVKSVIGQDPSGNGLFVFRSRRGDRLKVLTLKSSAPPVFRMLMVLSM